MKIASYAVDPYGFHPAIFFGEIRWDDGHVQQKGATKIMEHWDMFGICLGYRWFTWVYLLIAW